MFNGLLQDVAVIVLLDYDIYLGVKYGWKCVAGLIVVIWIFYNIIYEFNWEEVFIVYKNYVEKDCDCKMSLVNFFEILKCYLFGILKLNVEEVVRDFIFVNSEGGLVCVGEVLENIVLNIMKGILENFIVVVVEVVEEILN